MALDPHFGRFFCSKIDFFGSSGVQKCVLPHEIWTLKIVIFPRENAIFLQNPRFCFEVEIDRKHAQSWEKSLENKLFFLLLIFKGFRANLGGFWPPSWGSKKGVFWSFSPRGVQEAPKRLQERPKGVSRASNSLARGPQECPRAIKTCPGHAQGASKGSLFEGFSCFSMFFRVFLRFPAFFFVFLQRTPVNFSTLSSKLNCVRQQAKSSKSKQKQAKGSQSKQEPARV